MRAGAAIARRRGYDGRVNAVDERLLTLGLAGLGLAHELNTPLTTLGLRLELLTEQVRAGHLDAEALANQLDAARAQAQRMGTLIQRFRRFARGEPGLPEVVGVETLLEDTLQLVRPALAEAAATSLTWTGLPGVEVKVDRLLTVQALSCLVFNASDLLGEGRATTVHISAELDGSGDAVRIQVADDGPGFADPEAAVRLGWSSKGGRGMGVGLTFAAELAARMGGRLVLENRAQGGAQVTLVVPRLDPAGSADG